MITNCEVKYAALDNLQGPHCSGSTGKSIVVIVWS
ncbi:unnamed protein product, partial [Rotaria sp. Silwood2]